MDSQNELNLLLISDPQLSIRKVQLLRTQMQRDATLACVDLVLVAGNLLNLSRADRRSREHVAACVGDCATLLSAIEELTAKVAYVGGATDTEVLFCQDWGEGDKDRDGTNTVQDEPEWKDQSQSPASLSNLCRLSNYSLNAHGQCIDLGPELGVAIVGFGGALRGCPFATSEEMSRAISAPGGSADSARAAIEAGRQLLILTHLGCAGSDAVLSLVRSTVAAASGRALAADAVLLSVCGGDLCGNVSKVETSTNESSKGAASTCAASTGATETTEVNPGSLSQAGRYALVRLQREKKTWRVGSVKLCALS